MRHHKNSEEGEGPFQEDFTKGNLSLNFKNGIAFEELERIKTFC